MHLFNTLYGLYGHFTPLFNRRSEANISETSDHSYSREKDWGELDSHRACKFSGVLLHAPSFIIDRCLRFTSAWPTYTQNAQKNVARRSLTPRLALR